MVPPMAKSFYQCQMFRFDPANAAFKAAFYESKLFKEELEHTLLPPMPEKYDVVLVEAKNGLSSWR
jgi:hypothetical protein